MSKYSVSRHYASPENYDAYSQQSSSRYSSGYTRILDDSYFDTTENISPSYSKKSKKKKKNKKPKLSKEDLLFLNDEELQDLKAKVSLDKKKSKRKKHRGPRSPSPSPLEEEVTPPRKRSKGPKILDNCRGYNSGSRSPYHRDYRDSPYYKDRKKLDIPSAYADVQRSPIRRRNRSGSRSPNTVRLNMKREKIRKKLAALNRQEEKMEEERKRRQEIAAEEKKKEEQVAAEEEKPKVIMSLPVESTNTDVDEVDETVTTTNGTHKVIADTIKITQDDELSTPDLVIPGFDKDETKRPNESGSGSPVIDAILRSNRENSPENPNYRIDEDEGIRQFKILDKIGEGTYGQVYKARHIASGDIVALKKVRCETGKEDSKNKEGFPITAVREIKILKQLQHKNIITLKAIVTDKISAENYRRTDASIYLVFEYMDHDLLGLLDSGLVKFNELEIKICIRQLFEGLNYCHSKNFLHRDIKCANVLLNNKGEVKLADLGLARYWRKDDPHRLYTNKVITRWYRPPELLLGEEHYGPAVDIWSCGCILGEMFAKRALFRARSEQEQLEMICKICGTPTPDNWPGVIHLSLYNSLIDLSKKIYPRIVRKEYCYFPEDALDLVDKILTLDPDRRLTAEECLKHKFLSDINPTATLTDLPSNQDCHEMWCKNKRKEKKKSDFNQPSKIYQPP